MDRTTPGRAAAALSDAPAAVKAGPRSSASSRSAEVPRPVEVPRPAEVPRSVEVRRPAEDLADGLFCADDLPDGLVIADHAGRVVSIPERQHLPHVPAERGVRADAGQPRGSPVEYDDPARVVWDYQACW